MLIDRRPIPGGLSSEEALACVTQGVVAWLNAAAPARSVAANAQSASLHVAFA